MIVAVIRLKEDSMQITLRWLLAITASVAVLITSTQAAPVFTASVLFLAPLPALLAATCFRPNCCTRWFLLGALPIGLLLFYVGLIGPLCALVAMPEDWGFADARNSLAQNAPLAYPWFNEQVTPKLILNPLISYQEGWAAWVNSAW